MLNETIFWRNSTDTKTGFHNHKKNKYNKGRHRRKYSGSLISSTGQQILSMVVEKMKKM